MKPDERNARVRAEEVLHRLNISTHPVDPEVIAQDREIALVEHDLSPGVYGALAKGGGQFIIVVSSRCPTPGHRRFTIAHELGHYHLPGHIDEMFDEGVQLVESTGGHFRNARDPKEREADWFASELLAPRALALPRVQSVEPSVRALRTLAGEFGTSLTMMALRYGELTDQAVATVLSCRGTVEWVVCSDRVRAHPWSWGLRPGDSIPAGTATASLARDGEATLRGEERTDSNLVCEWFDAAPGDILVEEDALGLGKFDRILSFLLIPDLPDPEELEELEAGEEDRDWRDALREY